MGWGRPHLDHIPPSPSGGFLVTAGVNLLDSALHVASPHDDGVTVKENVLASGDYKSHSCKRKGQAQPEPQDRTGLQVYGSRGEKGFVLAPKLFEGLLLATAWGL